MSTAPIRTLTPEQYLEIERQAHFKSEFYRGEMFAMSGASYVPQTIQSNLIRHLGNRLEGSPCGRWGVIRVSLWRRAGDPCTRMS